MGYSSRPVRDQDLPWCAAILEDGFERVEPLRRELPRLWKRLLRDEAMSMIVVEDHRTNELVAFGAGSVIADSCLEAVVRGGRPNVAVRLMEAERADQPVILRPSAIRAVNHPEHGVNLCVLHYCELIKGRTFEEQRVIRDRALTELVKAQSGYCTREFFFEFYGEDDLPFTEVMGARLRDDYRAYYAASRDPRPEPRRRPFLVGSRREEQPWGNAIGTLFTYQEPVLWLSPMQQRVLIRACRTPTPTDADIADELGIERSTLRDHWRAIFSRVAEAGILQTVPDGSPLMRPALIAYLEQHPQELRPIDRRHFTPR